MNAAAQRLISADSHVVEPPEVFAAVAKRFGTQAPELTLTEDRGWVLDTGFGLSFQPGRFATAGLEPQSPDYEAQERSGYARACLTDPRARLADMDRDGVEAEVLFPTLLGSFVSRRETDAAVIEALLVSYNDWVADYCSEAPRRLFPLACVQLRDLHAAVAELERAKQRGHVGILVPCGSPAERPYADAAYDVLWAAAEEIRMPVAFHAGFGPDRDSRAEAFRRHGLRYVLQHVGAAVTISDLIMGGACERFPELRFVPSEYGTGWIAHFLDRMDWRQFRHEDRSRIRLRFSDYWRRNFRTTFEDDEVGIRTRDSIGLDSLMWANDYPHGDSIWPDSRPTLDRILADCTPEERHAMTVGNAAALYGLPIEA
jgi:predicted TIM-barrel fold metal-dependent hydrolase